MRQRVILVLALGLAGARLFGQVPADERIPVREPERLRAMGFAPDATNVYVWSRADRPRPTAPGELADSWGSAAGFTTVGPFEFEVMWPDRIDIFRDLAGGAQCTDNSSFEDAFDSYVHAALDLPNGARLGQFLFWAFDSHTEFDLPFEVYESCQAAGANGPTVTLIAENKTFLAIGQYFGFASLHDLTVDTKSCAYFVRVLFAPHAQDCVDEQLRIQKASVSWTRQVSPPPASATFGDVPTSHPFFPFVEALVKSGVTGGCGGNNFCPDASLTRGQMAVFLAKALGLQWP